MTHIIHNIYKNFTEVDTVCNDLKYLTALMRRRSGGIISTALDSSGRAQNCHRSRGKVWMLLTRPLLMETKVYMAGVNIPMYNIVIHFYLLYRIYRNDSHIIHAKGEEVSIHIYQFMVTGLKKMQNEPS